MPIGGVEVKKPNQYSSPMKDRKALGKLFDYLTQKHLQEGAMHATAPSYSPPTTNGTCVTWLPDAETEELAKLTTAGSPNVPQQQSVLPSDPPQWPRNDYLSTVELPKNDEPLGFLNGERKLHGGDTIEWDDCTLPEVLVSILQCHLV